MKKLSFLLTIILCFFINIAFATASIKTQLYKDLYYGMTKNDISKYFQFEVDEENPNVFYVYNHNFLGLNWDMRLSLDNKGRLNTVFLATESDENGDKLMTLISALGKSFTPVYAISDNNSIDLFYILRKNGIATYQKSYSDFIMANEGSSSSINIMNINNESLQKTSKIANSYIELIQKSPPEIRQAELIIQSYDDGSEILGVEFSAPKMQMLDIQNTQHENF